MDALKAHGVLLFQSRSIEPEDFDLDRFEVFLTYVDTEGDRVVLHSHQDLQAAMLDWYGAKNFKVFADVKEKKTPAVSRAAAATQTAKKLMNKPDKIKIEDLVESFVGLIAEATSTVASVADEVQEVLESEGKAKKPASCKKETAEAKGNAKKDEATPKQPPILVKVPDYAPVVEDEKPATKPSPKPEVPKAAPQSPRPVQKPFIHGRHTCDSCLTTPIVGKRFHAINMPDYDLCESCKDSYTGRAIIFEEAELGMYLIGCLRFVV